MKLAITPQALDKLIANRQSDGEELLLHYDTEDCGCGVNGIPTLRFIREKKDKFIKVDSETMPVWIDGRQAAFFEEEMKLEIVNGVFRLTSPAGILNPVIVPGDLRREDIA